MNDVSADPTAMTIATPDPLILKTFQNYAEVFETLKPSAVLLYYHYPAILISEQKPVKITNAIAGWVLFKIAMLLLKWRGYHHSKTESLNVRQLREDLAIVTGTVIRYKRDGGELERFDLNYTLRNGKHGWKIVVGALLTIAKETA